jgi:hypothetical protein
MADPPPNDLRKAKVDPIQGCPTACTALARHGLRPRMMTSLWTLVILDSIEKAVGLPREKRKGKKKKKMKSISFGVLYRLLL